MVEVKPPQGPKTAAGAKTIYTPISGAVKLPGLFKRDNHQLVVRLPTVMPTRHLPPFRLRAERDRSKRFRTSSSRGTWQLRKWRATGAIPPAK